LVALLAGQVSAASCGADIHPQGPHASQTDQDETHGPSAVNDCDQIALSALVTSRVPDRNPHHPALPAVFESSFAASAREPAYFASLTAKPSLSVPIYLSTARLRL
jgi:hypothetical protein